MLRSLKIGSVQGIGIYLHWSILILPFWVLFSTSRVEGPGPLFFLALTAAVFGCVILHELGHALAARCFGIGTRDITMYPIGGVARLERMSEKPWEELCIAVAGPAVNVVIALGLGVLMAFLGLALTPDMFVRVPATAFLMYLLVANVMLVAFNMLPAFPMDGGRVFRALLSSFLGRLRATRIAAGVAAVMAMLFGLWGAGALYELGPFFSQVNPLLVVLAGFIFFMGQQELHMVEMRERARRAEEALEVLPVVRPRPVPETGITLRPTISVYTWDSVNGIWVREGDDRPVRFPFPGTR